MLAKFAASALIIAGTICSSAFGQTLDRSSFGQQSSGQPTYYQPDDQSKIDTVSYARAGTLSDDETDKLKETVRLLELRLVELENDVVTKIGSQPEATKKSETESKVFDGRISDLEKGFEKQNKAVGKLEDAVPGFVVSGHKTPTMQFYGRLHLDYWSFPDVDDSVFPVEGGNPQDRVEFRRLRIGVSGDLNDNMFYKYEGEFAPGNNPSYRDAFIGFKELPYLNTVIIGNHKRPYGLDHLNSSKNNVFMERPFVVEAFNQDNRRLGISSNGVSEDEGWNWRFGVYNQELTQNSAGYIGDHYQAEFAARIARTAWYDESSGGRGYAHFALSGMAGTPDGRTGSTNNQARYRTRPEARSTNRWLDTGAISGANANSLIGLESVINIGSFNWTSEYLRTNVDRRDGVGEDVAFDGGYSQVSYLLTGEHHPWNRKTGTLGRLKPHENFFLVRDLDCNTQAGLGAWEVAFRYSYLDLNDFDIRGGEADSYTFGLNWYWNPYARMQFNYIFGDLHSGPGDIGQGDYQIAGVRLMVDF